MLHLTMNTFIQILIGPLFDLYKVNCRCDEKNDFNEVFSNFIAIRSKGGISISRNEMLIFLDKSINMV